MILRGLCIKKNPTFPTNENFTNKWNEILTNCLLKLMQLLITHDQERLQEIDNNIDTLQKSTTYKQLTTVLNDLNKTLERLETVIMAIKKNSICQGH